MKEDESSISKESGGNVKNSSASCDCLNVLHEFLRVKFFKLGFFIGKNPSHFIVVPIFLTLLAATGIQQMKYIKNPEDLFSPHNGAAKMERNLIEHYFKSDINNTMMSRRSTRWNPFIKVFISPKVGDTVLKVDVWKSMQKLDDMIRNVTINLDSMVYRYEDVCALYNGSCAGNLAFNLNDHIADIESGNMVINYPIMIQPFVLPHIFGGPEINETEGVLMSAKAVQIVYFLKSQTRTELEKAYAFEVEVLKLLNSISPEFENIRITYMVSQSLEIELDRNAAKIRPFLIVTVALMVLFSVTSVMLGDWVRSKLNIGLFGVLSSIMASVTACGFLMYCGVPFIGINMAVPFLILGIGLDDMFVLLSAWHRTSIMEDVPVRMAHAYSEAAVSVTITSLTNMMSFLIGCTTSFPAVQIFCLYTGVSTFFCYVWFICFFGGIMAVSGRNEKMGKHIITGKVALPLSKAGDRSCWYRFWCTGGINPSDPRNPMDNQPHIMAKFFRDYFGKLLTLRPFKGFVLIIFLVYVAGAIYGITTIQEGLERRKLTLDDSYLKYHFNEEDKYFKRYPYSFQVMFHGNISYSDPKQLKQLLLIHKQLEDFPHVASRLFTNSWIRGFFRFLRRKPHLKKNITDEASFVRILKKDFLVHESKSRQDIVFNDEGTRIVASRIIIESFNMTDNDDDRKLLVKLRQFAETAPVDMIIFSPLFVFFDQYLIVQSTTIQTIAYAALVMMVVSFIFIPNILCSFCVGFSIISIEIGVIGYMSLMGVNLDSVSMINLIMCIGFSVDFSAHISYAYLTAKKEDSDGRIRECLYSLGLPVLQGGVSTIVGVIVLAVAPSYIFLTFFKMVFLVISFGLLHGLFLLPVMLSILGPTPTVQNIDVDKIKTENTHEDEENFDIQRMYPVIALKASQKNNCSNLSKDAEDVDNDLGIGSSDSSNISTADSAHENLPSSDSESNIDSESRSSTHTDQIGKINKAYLDEDDHYGHIKL